MSDRVELKREVFFALHEYGEEGSYNLKKRDGFSFKFEDITLKAHQGETHDRVCITDAGSGMLVKTFVVSDSEVRGFIGKVEAAIQRVYSLNGFYENLLNLYSTEYYKKIAKGYACLLEARSYFNEAERRKNG